MIKYLGSKRTLLPSLVQILQGFPELRSVADVFAGTSRVGHAFKGAGFRVVANDHNAYAHCLAECYVRTDLEDVERDAELLLRELNGVKGRPGYFTQTFCVDSRFFQPHNGERIDAIRDAIDRKALEPGLRSVVMTSLMEAADRVDSTCGLQMAYVKQWAPRAYNPLALRMPAVLPAVPHGRCQALRMDANLAVREMDVDVAYIDPPYNQHSYLGNYHIWESLVLWDKPEVYGVARKRVDCRERKSDYNSKRLHQSAFEDLIAGISAPLLLISFNNEGYQSRPNLERLLAAHGKVFVIAKDFKRYVGAQIGVYNPDGDKVGTVSHLRNEEYIYLVARPSLSERIPDALERLELLAARVGDGAERQVRIAQNSSAVDVDRVSVVARSLGALGTATQAVLQKTAGLSGYQTRMALESLVGRGLARVEGERRSRRYSACCDLADDGIGSPEPGAGVRSNGSEHRDLEAHRAGENPSLKELRSAIVAALGGAASRSSEELQRIVGRGPAELRAVLATMASDGAITRLGQRRGTRYVLVARASASPATPDGASVVRVSEAGRQDQLRLFG